MNDTGPLSKSNSAIGNSALAPTQTPTLAKQPTVAPPSLTLEIPFTPASSSGSNSAQSLRRRQALQNTSQLTNSPAYSPTLTDRFPYPQLAGRRNEFRGPAPRVTHSNSRTWNKDINAERRKWIQLEKNMKMMRFIRSPQSDPYSPRKDKFSPFVPTTFYDYLGHRAAVEAENARRAAFLEEQRNLDKKRKSKGQPKIESIFESRKPTDGENAVVSLPKSAVVSRPTIWSNWYVPTESEAPWPSPEEFRVEGNERNGSHFRRFLPLLRVPGNNSVAWQQRSQLKTSDFDEVHRLSDLIERGHQASSIREANEARGRRIEEEKAIVLADQESNLFRAEKMEEAWKTGLSEKLAENEANAETEKHAREIALKKVEQEEETKTLAEMREFLCESLINGLSCSDENKLEEEKNKEDNENKSNEKHSKNEG